MTGTVREEESSLSALPPMPQHCPAIPMTGTRSPRSFRRCKRSSATFSIAVSPMPAIAATTPLSITSSKSTRPARSAASRRKSSTSSNGVPPLSPSSAISRNITAWAAITLPTPAATPSTPCSPPPGVAAVWTVVVSREEACVAGQLQNPLNGPPELPSITSREIGARRHRIPPRPGAENAQAATARGSQAEPRPLSGKPGRRKSTAAWALLGGTQDSPRNLRTRVWRRLRSVFTSSACGWGRCRSARWRGAWAGATPCRSAPSAACSPD